MAFFDRGPGISVRMIGAAGSSGKKGCSLASLTDGEAIAAAAEACLGVVAEAIERDIGRWVRTEALARAGCSRAAVRMSEAMVEDRV